MDAVRSRSALHQCYSTPLVRKSTSFFASLSSDRLLPSLDVRDMSAPQTIVWAHVSYYYLEKELTRYIQNKFADLYPVGSSELGSFNFDCNPFNDARLIQKKSEY